MRGLLRRLRALLAPVARVREASDPVLGPLLLEPDDQLWWRATRELGGRPVDFDIGGEAAPDPTLVAHAGEIVQGFPAFEARIMAYLEGEARLGTDLPGYAEEVRALRICAISLWWPARPRDGVIHFLGPAPHRLWRCEYFRGAPRHLVFDS